MKRNPLLSLWSVLAAIALIPALCAGVCAGETRAGTISCDELAKLRATGNGLRIIDVRSAGEFDSGHITGAVNIPAADILSAGLPKDETLVLYCSGIGCSLSAKAARNLANTGYAKVLALEGGLNAWRTKGLPIASNKAEEASGKKPGLRNINPEELKAVLGKGDKITVLDLRAERECALGRIPGARSMPLEELGGSQYAVCKDTNALVVVYDRLAARSRAGAARLDRMGCRNARILSGGIVLWAAKGYPLDARAESYGR